MLLFAVLLFVGAAAGAPPEHDVHADGGTSVTFDAPFNKHPTRVYGPIAPTTALSNVRCQAWLQDVSHRGTCPDDTVLAQDYWPELTQAGATLYVGLTAFCDTSPPHFNAERVGRSLTLHCHTVASWISFERAPMGVSAEPLTGLLLIPTPQLGPGPLSVYREDRVERWLSDQVTVALLGTVTISNSE